MESSESGGAAAGGGIALHDFSGRLGEQRVHFHAMRLRDSLFLWVGAAPALASLAVAMCTPRDSIPVAASLLGDPSDTASACLAQRLGSVWPTALSMRSQELVFAAIVAVGSQHVTDEEAFSLLQRPGATGISSQAAWEAALLKGFLGYLSLPSNLELVLGFITFNPDSPASWSVQRHHRNKASKTKKQIFVSYNLQNTDSNFTLLIENRIKEEMMAFPEKF